MMLTEYFMENLAQAIPDFIGVIGVAFILGMYFLLQIGKLDSKDAMYSIGNLIGSSLLLISLFFDWNLSAVVLQCAWIMISAYGLYKAFAGNTKKVTN